MVNRRRERCAVCRVLRPLRELPVLVKDFRPVGHRMGNRLYNRRAPLRLCGYVCFIVMATEYVNVWMGWEKKAAARFGAPDPRPNSPRLGWYPPGPGVNPLLDAGGAA